MAHDKATADGHPDMDYAEHEKTYEMFLGMAKWGTIVVVALVVLLGFLTL